MDRSARLKRAIAQWRDGSVRAFQKELEPRMKEQGVRGGSYASIHRYLSAWEHLSVRTAALALLVQGGAAIAGCWLGYRYAPVRVE